MYHIFYSKIGRQKVNYWRATEKEPEKIVARPILTGGWLGSGTLALWACHINLIIVYSGFTSNQLT